MPHKSHILVLTDRDWTHPQGGGTGTNLFGQVTRWLAWGHRVSIIAAGYSGALRFEQHGALTIHRLGGRTTVFPWAIWRQGRGLVPDADVVLEVVNGITFLTPLWLRTPRVALVHHVHAKRQYEEEMGRVGPAVGFLLESAPLRWLYRGSRFLTPSRATVGALVELGIPRRRVEVAYNGVESDLFRPGARAATPTILHLGRLKRYKHVEQILDALEAIPDVVLDLAGDGDHRRAIEEGIARRGLTDRVRLHGHVDEPTKLLLLQRAWVHVTASTTEGWCLGVMEAAACGTPSVALGMGGVREAIEHEHTGLLARDVDELSSQIRRVLFDPELRERLGRAARTRARSFTWERTASRTLEVLEQARSAAASPPRQGRRFVTADSARAAGLAGAMLVNSAIALLFTLIFAHLLSATAYGSLGALVSGFLILSVPGSALQAAAARAVGAAAAAGEPDPAATLRPWLRRLVLLALPASALAVLAREAIATGLAVDEQWAAAAAFGAAWWWLVLCVQRGVLQGLRRYRPVALSLAGEAAARLAFALVLFALGLGVTGAILGTGLSIMTTSAVLSLCDRGRRRVRAQALPAFMRGALPAVASMALLALLQNLDVILFKHRASGDLAGAYVATSVAAKASIWIAVGLGFFVVPETARRARAGHDARPVLARTLLMLGVAVGPLLGVYALIGGHIMRAVFGARLAVTAEALPWLAFSVALLGCSYLVVQYLLGLGQRAFVALLGAAVPLQAVVVLATAPRAEEVALSLVGVQGLLILSLFALVVRPRAVTVPAVETA